MSLIRNLTRAYMINRVARSGRRRAAQRSWGYGRGPQRYSRRSRGRGGFFGPLPFYSRQTRGGSRVTVSGCCLPIPLGVLGALALAARLLTRR
jgi:hypothetical protein